MRNIVCVASLVPIRRAETVGVSGNMIENPSVSERNSRQSFWAPAGVSCRARKNATKPIMTCMPFPLDRISAACIAHEAASANLRKQAAIGGLDGGARIDRLEANAGRSDLRRQRLAR